MKRYVIAGGLLFVAFAIGFAPAGLLDRAVDQVTGVDLVDARGTVWQGNARLLAEGAPLGQLVWDFQPTSLLRLTPAYAWQLERSDGRLDGTAGSSFSRSEVTLQGNLAAEALNAWLRAYDISLSGALEVAPSSASVPHGTRLPEQLTGQINWRGGSVLYTLSGLRRQVSLPSLTAYLDIDDQGLPSAVVYGEGNDTPLLVASLSPDGFAKIGITKLFTKLLQNPYPGSDPDHAIVLEVEEQIF